MVLMFGEINVYEARVQQMSLIVLVLCLRSKALIAASRPRPPPWQKPGTRKKTETAVSPLHQVRNLGQRLQLSFCRGKFGIAIIGRTLRSH